MYPEPNPNCHKRTGCNWEPKQGYGYCSVSLWVRVKADNNDKKCSPHGWKLGQDGSWGKMVLSLKPELPRVIPRTTFVRIMVMVRDGWEHSAVCRSNDVT